MTTATTYSLHQAEKGQRPDAGLSHSEDEAARRAELGQFLTPKPVADFMASLFEARWKDLNLLDAGAGAGALSTALVRRLCVADRKPRRITVTAYELDSTLIAPLREALSVCQNECERAGIFFSASIFNEDFIEAVVPLVRGTSSRRNRLALMRP